MRPESTERALRVGVQHFTEEYKPGFPGLFSRGYYRSGSAHSTLLPCVYFPKQKWDSHAGRLEPCVSTHRGGSAAITVRPSASHSRVSKNMDTSHKHTHTLGHAHTHTHTHTHTRKYTRTHTLTHTHNPTRRPFNYQQETSFAEQEVLLSNWPGMIQ